MSTGVQEHRAALMTVVFCDIGSDVAMSIARRALQLLEPVRMKCPQLHPSGSVNGVRARPGGDRQGTLTQ